MTEYGKISTTSSSKTYLVCCLMLEVQWLRFHENLCFAQDLEEI